MIRDQLLSTFVIIAGLVLAAPIQVAADTIVVVNRSQQAVSFELRAGETKSKRKLAAGELVPLTVAGQAALVTQGASAKEYQLDPNSVYYFRDAQGGIDLQRIDLGDDAESTRTREVGDPAAMAGPQEITVKILVDEDEVTVPKIWQPRLQRRVEAVSEHLVKFCNVRLKVVAFDRWNTNNDATDLTDLLQEFTKSVDPAPADIAIGFTAQFNELGPDLHWGGVHGPFRKHMLVREWSRGLSEVERQEVLLHEVGHLFGATHSPEPDSVMRPKLGDGRSRRRGFQLAFDAPNVLVMNMLLEEYRLRKARSAADLLPGTRRRIAQVYGVLGSALPGDPASRELQRIVGLPDATTIAAERSTPTTEPAPAAADSAPIPDLPDEQLRTGTPLVKATHELIRAITLAGLENARLPRTGDDANPPRRTGDALTEYLVRRGAAAAANQPTDVAARALLLSLGITLGDSDVLVNNPLTRDLAQQVESAEMRQRRRQAIGAPTIHGRRDLAQHFFVSAFLTAALGAPLAETAGLAKEVSDANGGSGFSFADLAADLAGCAMGRELLAGTIEIKSLNAFAIPRFMMAIDDLDEGLKAADLEQQYGNVTDTRFRAAVQEIRHRVEQLPAYSAR